MADQYNFNPDDVAQSIDKARQLRDQLAAKAGKSDAIKSGQPSNQEENKNISIFDIPKQVGGELTSFMGDAVKNYVPTVRKFVDGAYEQPTSDLLASAITGKTPEQLHENGLLGLNEDAQFVGVDPSSNPIRNAPGYVLNKAADAAQFVGDKVGGGVEHVGGLIKDTVSDVGKQKLSEEWLPDNGGKSAFSDPQAWAMKMSNTIGMVAGIFATGGVGNGTNSAIKGLVKKSMLKRGATDEFANSVADLTEKNLAGQSVILGGGVGMSLSSTADQARESTNNLSVEQLMQSPTFVQNWKDIAADPQYQDLSPTDRAELAKQKTAVTAGNAASADPVALAGAVASNIIGDIPLFKMISGEPAKVVGNALSRAVKNGVKTAPIMGAGMAVDQAARQYAVNDTENQVAGTSIDPMQNVASSALESGIDGAMTGLVAGGIHGITSKPAQTSNSNDQVSDASPDQQSESESNSPVPENNSQPSTDPLNTPAYQRQGDISPELQAATQQTVAEQQQLKQNLAAEENGVLTPIEKSVTGNPDEPAFLRTQQNNPTGRDTSTLQDANPYTESQSALAAGGALTAENLIQQSIQQGNQGKTPQESGVTGDLLLASEHAGAPAATEQSGTTIDGQSNEVIPESRGLGYNNQINMPGQSGNSINDNYVPPITNARTTADKLLDTESTRDPRSPLAQSIERAGSESASVFDQLKTVRVTKRGNPFASQKEAQLASRKTETPIELPTGGYGVVDKAELEQAQSNISQSPDVNESTPNQVVAQNQPNINVNEQSQTVTPEITESAAINDQLDAQQEIPVIAKPAMPWTGYKDKPDGTMLLEGDTAQLSEWAKANNVLTIKSKSGVIVGKKSAPIVKDIIAKNSNETQAIETKTQDVPPQVIAEKPWKNVIDKADGTMVMEGDPVQLREWAKQNNITAIKSKTGIVVGKNSVPVVKDIIAKSNAPTNAQQNEATPTEILPSQPTEIIAPPQSAEAEGSTPAAPVPWTNSIDKPDGTMILEGDPVALKAWAKENDITAIKSKTGVVVGKSSVQAVKNFISKQQASDGKVIQATDKIQGGNESQLTSQSVLKSKSADNSNKSGISKEEVDRVVEEFKREYKGNIPLDIRAFQSQEEAYGPEATIERFGKIEGGYLPASQKIHLIADDIRPEDTQRKLSLPGGRKLEVGAHTERAVSGDSILRESGPGAGYTEAIKTTLRHEVLGHYGLNTLDPQQKRELIGKIRSTRDDDAVKPYWEKVDNLYGDKPESKKAEEVFAFISEERSGFVSDAWNRVLSSFHGMMRRNKMLSKDITISEIRELARSTAKGIRNGDKQQKTFPVDNESQYRKTDTETADKGGFSLSTMPKNEAEISGKGMTKPEAALVAKQWLRQFKTDINVAVVKDQAEFESALADRGFANSIQSGEMDNAAYLPDSKTILINASAIQNQKRLKQIMRHEILVHHGLRYVVGEEAYAKIMNAIARGYETSPAIRDAVDAVTKNYADKDMFTQMEEAFAHYAENRPADSGPIGRLWQRIVGMVKSALQKVNFVSQNESEQHLDEVLHAIAKNMRNGIEAGIMAHKSDDAMFSRKLTDDEERMSKIGLGPKPGVIDKAMERVSQLRESDKNTIKSWFDRLGKKYNTQVLDYLAPIKYAEDKSGKVDASESAYVAARLSSGSATVMNATLLYGLPEWRDGVIQRKAGTSEKDALLGIFEELGPDLHNWLAWMAGHRAEILAKEGRENLLTADDIAAYKDKGNGKEAQFNAAKQKWSALNKAVLDLGEHAGLFTPEERATWQNEWYVPFFRETEDGDVTAPYSRRGIANQSSGVKQLKGGTANVNDLLENIFTSTGKMIDASMKNMAAQKVVHNLAETDLITVLDKPNLMDIQAGAKYQKGKLLVKIEGETYVVQVNDEPLFNAMTMIDQKVERGFARKMAIKAKHLLTAGITSGPEFMMRNFLRDAVSTWAINEDGFKPMIDSIRGVKKSFKMEGGSIDMMFSGASFMGGHLRGNDPQAMSASVRKALRRKGLSPEQINEYEHSLITTGKKAADVIGHYWEKYERIGEAVENGSREAVYEAAIKAGKSHAQAAFEAKDLMDFSMHGASGLMQGLVDVLPFFNARMQGLGKLGRALRDNPKQIARRAGLVAGISLGLLALNWDDPRYEDLPDWDKDTNWHFWFGDQHFRIPKPFEIGLMFGTLPERMVRTMGSKDTAGKFGQVVARNMLETFAINPVPQVIKPLAEAYVNYDPFKGGPIDNMSDQNVLPEARYDNNTSLLMRNLGELTGFSPKRLEHIVLGYTGTMGAYVMGLSDMIVHAVGDYGQSPAIRADQIPLIKAVYQGTSPARNTQAMQDFYSLLNEANQLYATVKEYRKEGRDEDATKLFNENQKTISTRKALNNAQLQFRAIRNEMALIERDKLLDSDQKRERIDALLKRRNNMAAQLVTRFER
ncbi:MAG: hypothetical protein PHV54_00865 [Tolumonas sp.]|nr:hypothetical protein [Tolumonas sp.]